MVRTGSDCVGLPDGARARRSPISLDFYPHPSHCTQVSVDLDQHLVTSDIVRLRLHVPLLFLP
ncbi:hypothetical protein M404DRAFT_999743 [Pisolithus tinctorius Marx 270]|uniref:Uncharacterized protein n=1 Tax=Pisolithus tinctorius Marx 270 TaxID=870435 RepID=A0A0C3J991_PISTI|nr:hypothetical protein M404DRAFT_999743 [Pisolithus tinctorius Marx 270]